LEADDQRIRVLARDKDFFIEGLRLCSDEKEKLQYELTGQISQLAESLAVEKEKINGLRDIIDKQASIISDQTDIITDLNQM
jgi:hypothetical protein